MKSTYSPKGNIHGPILPSFILQRAISLGAKVMYAILCDYAGKSDHCWPSHKTLAEKLACSVTSIKKYLSELVNENLVAVKRENYRSSVYYLLRPKEMILSNAPEKANQTMCSGHPQTPTPPPLDAIPVQSISGYTESDCGGTQHEVGHRDPESGCSQSKSCYLTTVNNQKENTPPNPPGWRGVRAKPQKQSEYASAPAARGVSASLSDFEEVWKLYPKKAAIGFARRIWAKLHKQNRLPALEEMISAIKRFADSPGWQQEEGRYIPQLGKWLMDERWLDGFSDNPDAQHAEAIRKMKQLQDFMEKRELERKMKQEAQNKDRRPIFDAFLSRFSDAEQMRGPAWGFWNLLYSKGKAPRADHVPPDNTLGVMKYLQLCRAA